MSAGAPWAAEAGASLCCFRRRRRRRDFYNLELKDTNVVDHNTHDYSTQSGLRFEIVDEQR